MKTLLAALGCAALVGGCAVDPYYSSYDYYGTPYTYGYDYGPYDYGPYYYSPGYYYYGPSIGFSYYGGRYHGGRDHDWRDRGGRYHGAAHRDFRDDANARGEGHRWHAAATTSAPAVQAPSHVATHPRTAARRAAGGSRSMAHSNATAEQRHSS